MQANTYKTTYSCMGRFIIEKIQELCHNRSLDSYRVRYLNPKSAITELYNLINDWNKNRIKDFNTVIACSEEVNYLLKTENYLDFGTLSKDKLENNINLLIKEKKISDSLDYELYYLLSKNENYLQNLFREIDSILLDPFDTIKNKITCCLKLDKLLDYSISEAINLKFSKSYISKLNQALFIYNEKKTFEESWQIFKEILTTRQLEKYSLIFSIQGSENQLNNITLPEVISEIDRTVFATTIEPKINNFIKPKESKRFVLIEIMALDYYQAMKLGKKEFAKILDRIHVGYSNLKIRIRDTAIVVNSIYKEKADLQPIHYQIDGYYRSENSQYEQFIADLQKIDENASIAYEVKERINSALRQLRLGNEAIEIEKKFINYWIGLEFIFSNYDKDKSTFKRLLDYFPIIHSVYYIKRNLVHFHDSLKIFPIEIASDEELKYLTETTPYDEIINEHFEQYPLLAYRASRLKSHLTNATDKRTTYLTRHKTHLEWHLTRLYRVRNELIHDAAIIEHIENLTANLRYYLNFILNKQIDFFSDCSPKPIENKAIIMDDFFMHHLMIYEYLNQNKLTIEEAIKMKYTLDYLR